MGREVLRTDAAPGSALYAQGTKNGSIVCVSGMVGIDPGTGQLAGTTIQEQTRQCLTNVRAILTAAGSSLDKVVSATVILAEEDDFAGSEVCGVARQAELLGIERRPLFQQGFGLRSGSLAKTSDDHHPLHDGLLGRCSEHAPRMERAPSAATAEPAYGFSAGFRSKMTSTLRCS